MPDRVGNESRAPFKCKECYGPGVKAEFEPFGEDGLSIWNTKKLSGFKIS